MQKQGELIAGCENILYMGSGNKGLIELPSVCCAAMWVRLHKTKTQIEWDGMGWDGKLANCRQLCIDTIKMLRS